VPLGKYVRLVRDPLSNIEDSISTAYTPPSGEARVDPRSIDLICLNAQDHPRTKAASGRS
jgi:hypothetical protein